MFIAFFAVAIMSLFLISGDANATAASDIKDCSNFSIDPDKGIAACTRLNKHAKEAIAIRNLNHWRGIHQNRKGNYDAAIKELDRAINASPTLHNSFSWRAAAWAAKNEPARAVEDYTRAIKLNPLPEYYEARAAQLLKSNEIGRAEADLNEAIRLEPSNVDFYLKRADLLRNNNQASTALADANKAVELSPKNFNAYHHRAYIWDAMGEPRKAIGDYSESIKLNNKVAALFKARAATYARLGEWRNLIDDLDAALRLDPSDGSLVESKISGFLMLEEYDVVIQAASTMIEKTPKSSAALNYRGLAYQGRKQYDLALEDVDQALSLDPKNPTFLTNRSNILREMGDLDGAIRILSSVIAESSAPAGAYNNRSLAWRAKNDLDRALRDLNEAIRLAPNYVDAYANRGQIFEAMGDRDRATADYRSALKEQSGGVFIKRYQRIAQARLDVLGAASEPPQPLSPQKTQTDVADRRIALVIGNGAYKRAGQLVNPPNDASLLAKALRQLNFSVVEGVDLDHAAMKRTINAFMADVPRARIAVVFYAGHGMQIEGKNYLLPIDADTQSASFTHELVEVDSMLSGLDDQIRTNIIILDACRDNPLAREKVKVAATSRSVTARSGLAAPSGLGAGGTVGAGTLLAFATAPGQVALDGDGANSPFSSALNKHITTPGIEIQQMLTRVRNDVVAATKSKQVPWSNSSLLGEVYLAAKP